MISFELYNPIAALNAGLFISPGFGTHAERVIDSYELIYVTRGNLDIFEDSSAFSIACNQTLLLFPGRRHGGRLPYSRDVNFYWVHFQVRESGSQSIWLNVPKVATIRNPERLTELFCRFISDQEVGFLEPNTAAHMVSLMLCVVGDSKDEAHDGHAHQAFGDKRAALARKVQNYIEEHFREHLSSAIIAGALQYDADYLERVFKKCMRVSILEALHHTRIGAARALLQMEARHNINEIAYQCGFADPGYFRRIFKRLTGLTPKGFRALYAFTHINTH